MNWTYFTILLTLACLADELRRQHAALVQHPEITQLAARIDAAIAQSQQQQ